MSNGQSINAIAREYRREWGKSKAGGFVVFFGREPQGWIDQLRNPEHWRPGCVAIDDEGKRWIAMGGNNYDGASEWVAA